MQHSSYWIKNNKITELCWNDTNLRVVRTSEPEPIWKQSNISTKRNLTVDRITVSTETDRSSWNICEFIYNVHKIWRRRYQQRVFYLHVVQQWWESVDVEFDLKAGRRELFSRVRSRSRNWSWTVQEHVRYQSDTLKFQKKDSRDDRLNILSL